MSWNSLELFLFAVCNFFVFFSIWYDWTFTCYHTYIISSFTTLLKKGLNERAMKNERDRMNNKGTGQTGTLI